MSGFADYDDYDALGLAGLVRAGEVSPEQLLEEAIARIDRVNGDLNAVITPMYDEARRTLQALPDGAFRGVPFLLKDLLQAYRGVPMSFGSAALRNSVPDFDSTVVERYRAAGLVTLGKTNVPEFGLVAVTEPEAFGPTRNPWNLDHSPGGSSGGSAAVVAAGIVPMASANDGGGSIRIPASWCGLFGLKPSRGRVPVGPQDGEVWEGALAQLGVSRTVRDSAALLDAICGPAPGDPYWLPAPQRPFLTETGIEPRPLRIAYSVRSPIGSDVDPECSRAVEHTVGLLTCLGHNVEESDAPIDGMELARAYLTLYYGSVSADLRRIRAESGRDGVDGFEEVTRLVANIGETISAAEYVEARRKWNGFSRAMATFHESYDLYLTPTNGTPPPRIGSLKPSLVDRIGMKVVNRSGSARLLLAAGVPEKLALEQMAPAPFTQLANLTGQPAMSVPLYWTEDGLPVGSHFMAPVGDEATLFQVAGQLERVQPWSGRRPPTWADSQD